MKSSFQYIKPLNWLMKISTSLKEFRKNAGILTTVEISNPKTSKKMLVKALWDTGATFTCISPRALEMLALEEKGFYILSLPNSTTEVKNYSMLLKVDPNKTPQYELTVGVFESSNEFDIIIGLDLILNGKLSIWVEKGVFNFEFDDGFI